VQTRDNCFKCRVLQEGQFCWPGNYTVEFKISNQCKDVTFGGCDIEIEDTLDSEYRETPQRCDSSCKNREDCGFYRYHKETKNCTLIHPKYRKTECNIRAGPTDNDATQCLFQDNRQRCDLLIDEECTYHGENLKEFPEGAIITADACQFECEDRKPRCKYWIFHYYEKLCILKKEHNKTCSVWGGPGGVKNPTFNELHPLCF